VLRSLPRTSRPRSRRRLDAREADRQPNNTSIRRLPGARARRDHRVVPVRALRQRPTSLRGRAGERTARKGRHRASAPPTEAHRDRSGTDRKRLSRAELSSLPLLPCPHCPPYASLLCPRVPLPCPAEVALPLSYRLASAQLAAISTWLLDPSRSTWCRCRGALL